MLLMSKKSKAAGRLAFRRRRGVVERRGLRSVNYINRLLRSGAASLGVFTLSRHESLLRKNWCGPMCSWYA